jgi:hypothetical protein
MTAWRQSCAVFCGNLRICDLQINHENLRIYNKKFENLSHCKSKFEKIPRRVWIRNKLFWTHNMTGVGVSNISAAIIQ